MSVINIRSYFPILFVPLPYSHLYTILNDQSYSFFLRKPINGRCDDMEKIKEKPEIILFVIFIIIKIGQERKPHNKARNGKWRHLQKL